MTTATAQTAQPPASKALGETVADLIDRLGGISPARIRLWPPPGTATESDLIELGGRDDRLFELVDGTLVEKGMGYRESLLALVIASFLRNFVVPRNLGLASGADGMLRLFPGLVRGPDVAFVSWDRTPTSTPAFNSCGWRSPMIGRSPFTPRQARRSF